MDGQNQKKFLHHWRKKRVSTWELLAIFVAGVSASVYFLRQNNLKMVQLRNDVVTADSTNGDVAKAIEDLNYHVFHHMNTKIVRPIELVNTYNKQAALAIQAASQGSGPDLYAEGTAQCERRGIPLASIAQCISDYALSRSSGGGPKEIKLPDKNLFIYTFAAPRWTPDAAGFSVFLTVVIGAWLLARFVEYILVRLIVRRRLKNGF